MEAKIVFVFIYLQTACLSLTISDVVEGKSTQLSLEVDADQSMYIEKPSSVCLNLHITIMLIYNSIEILEPRNNFRP
jgi:hypothetical protein